MSERGLKMPMYYRFSQEGANQPKKMGDYSLMEWAEHIKRDLEDLLNTRSRELVRVGSKINNAVINFGIPDCSTVILDTDESYERFAQSIKKIIQTYENRLMEPEVHVDRDSITAFGVLNIYIHAGIRYGKASSEVTFSTQYFTTEYNFKFA